MLRRLVLFAESVTFAAGVFFILRSILPPKPERPQHGQGVVCRKCGQFQSFEEFLDPTETCDCKRVRL